MSRSQFVREMMPALLVLENQSLDFKSLSPHLHQPFRLLKTGCDEVTSDRKICPMMVEMKTHHWRYEFWYWYWFATTF
jgi:hypothetical protein